jgi:hypothetical protein
MIAARSKQEGCAQMTGAVQKEPTEMQPYSKLDEQPEQNLKR